eukprot:s1880_g24.t1
MVSNLWPWGSTSWLWQSRPPKSPPLAKSARRKDENGTEEDNRRYVPSLLVSCSLWLDFFPLRQPAQRAGADGHGIRRYRRRRGSKRLLGAEIGLLGGAWRLTRDSGFATEPFACQMQIRVRGCPGRSREASSEGLFCFRLLSILDRAVVRTALVAGASLALFPSRLSPAASASSGFRSSSSAAALSIEASELLPVCQELLPLHTSLYMNRARCRQNLGRHEEASQDGASQQSGYFKDLSAVLGLWQAVDKRMLQADPEMKEAELKGLYTAEYLRARSRLARGLSRSAAQDSQRCEGCPRAQSACCNREAAQAAQDRGPGGPGEAPPGEQPSGQGAEESAGLNGLPGHTRTSAILGAGEAHDLAEGWTSDFLTVLVVQAFCMTSWAGCCMLN